MLLGFFNFRCEQYRSGALSEDRSTLLTEFLDRIRQSLFLQELQLRRALAARQNQTVTTFELIRSGHLCRIRAQPRQHRRVRFKVSLNCQNPDLHFTGSKSNSLTRGSMETKPNVKPIELLLQNCV